MFGCFTQLEPQAHCFSGPDPKISWHLGILAPVHNELQQKLNDLRWKNFGLAEVKKTSADHLDISRIKTPLRYFYFLNYIYNVCAHMHA